MKTAGMVLGMAVLLAACGGGEDALDEPQEAPIAGGDAPLPPVGEATDGTETTGETDNGPAQTGTDLDTIPAKYHGVWDAPGSDCENYTDGLTEVRAREVIYYEGGAKVLGVEMVGADAVVELESLPYGDDEATDSTERFALMTTPQGLRLHVTNAAEDDRESDYPLQRCSK